MNYENLTVEQYQKIQGIEADNIAELRSLQYAIITGKTIDEVDSLSPVIIFKETDFLLKPLHAMPLNKRYGRFEAITDISNITAAQHKDFTTFLKLNNNDYIKCLPHILAIIHKEITISGYKYLSHLHFKNVEIFKKAKLKDVIGAVFFYSKCLKSYSKILRDSLDHSNLMMKELIVTMSEDIEFQTFLNNGGGTTQ
jgi:hypothetical protein